ncbi:hypothetical protein BOX15_Mlig019506g3, partial [Macrostomum lignano]
LRKLMTPMMFLVALLLLLALGMDTHQKIFSNRGHSLTGISAKKKIISDTVPATIDNPLPSGACGAYSELRSVNFLHKSISESICEGAAAYTIVDSAFPLCRLKQHLPPVLTEGVRVASVQTFIRSPLTQRNLSSFVYVYSSPDLISNIIRTEHIFEKRNIRIMQQIIRKLAAKSPVTFMDIGSNIGVFSLPILDLGVPVIALDANIRNLIRLKLSAEAAKASEVDSAFPLCRLKQHLPPVLTEGVRVASVQTFIRSPLTQRNLSSFVYSSPDLISNIIRTEHIFEKRNIRIMQQIIRKLAAKSPVTFMDIGSNIGVFSLPILDLGVPVIALDANIRNLIRLKLSAEAAKLPHKLHLLWNFVNRQVSLMYLNFPKECNMGGATKLGRAVVDTIPVMSATADSIVPLVDTKLVVMKVDIEGGEGEFFKSAKKLFDSFTIPVVHMEWLKRHMSDMERQFMIRFFYERRYSPRSMNDLTKLININLTGYEGDDLVWVHKHFEDAGILL